MRPTRPTAPWERLNDTPPGPGCVVILWDGWAEVSRWHDYGPHRRRTARVNAMVNPRLYVGAGGTIWWPWPEGLTGDDIVRRHRLHRFPHHLIVRC